MKLKIAVSFIHQVSLRDKEATLRRFGAGIRVCKHFIMLPATLSSLPLSTSCSSDSTKRVAFTFADFSQIFRRNGILQCSASFNLLGIFTERKEYLRLINPFNVVVFFPRRA